MPAFGGVITEDENRVAFLLHCVLLVSIPMESFGPPKYPIT
jgi:hypothetical protein